MSPALRLPAACLALLVSTLASGATFAAPSAAPLPAAEACPRLEPGRALGRFSLGTRLTAPDAVEPDALPGWSRPKDPAGRATRLRFDAAGVLDAIDAPLPACVTLPSPKPHEVRTAELRTLAAALGTCGPEDIREGGTVIPCAGLSLVTTVGAAGVEHRLSMRGGADAPPAPTATCDTWLDAEGPVDVTGRRAPPAAPGVPGELEIGTRRVCLSGRPMVFTTATRPADVTDAACTTEANRGGTHVRCGGTLFSFGGPQPTLTRIRVER